MRSTLCIMSAVLAGTLGASAAYGSYFVGGSYFMEAEEYVAENGTATWTAGDGPHSSDAMSGNAYLQVLPGSASLFHLPADTLAPGTYYLAVRSSSGAGDGLFVDHAIGLAGIDGAFNPYGLTYNPESGTPGEMGWDWAENYWNSNEFVSLTVVAGEAHSFRLLAATGTNVSVDLIALLDSNDALPAYVPEPTGIGALMLGAAMMCKRRLRVR